mgnify:CR=1 FL=1
MSLSKPSDEDKIDRSSSRLKKKKDPVQSLRRKVGKRHRNISKPVLSEMDKLDYKDRDKTERLIKKLRAINKGTKKDLALIDDYGVDAPRDRGFMTDYERTENKAGGGKVRGAGAALGGYGRATYSDKLI